MADHKSPTQAEHRAKAHSMLKGAGYSGGGKMTPAKAVHKHEAHLHKGAEPTKLARGGAAKGPKEVNIVIKTGGDDAEKKMAMQQGMQMGAKMAAGAPKPPMGPPPGMAGPGGPGGPPPGGPPPGMMPPHPPGAGPMAKGGFVKVREHHRRTGGKCE